MHKSIGYPSYSLLQKIIMNCIRITNLHQNIKINNPVHYICYKNDKKYR